MSDFSWIAPATKGLANIFGLNPEVAARGRNMQSENDLLLARTANTQADTALSPYRQRVLEAQAGAQGALGTKYGAEAGKTKAETEGINFTNAGRRGLSQAFANGAAGLDAEGNLVIRKEAVNQVGGFLMAMDADPEKSMKAFRGLAANASTTARGRGQADGIAAAFGSNASFSAKEGQDIEAAKAAASKDEAIAVQQEKNKGSLAEAFQKAGLPNAANAVDQMELNRQIDAIKEGAAWAMKVPIGPGGGFLNEEQAMSLAQAARAANPTLNVPDAIRKFVQDNPKMMKGNWELLPWVNNKVDFPNGIPSVVPAAPAAAPAAPRSTAPASSNGVTMERMVSVPGQPAAAAPAAIPAPAARVAGQVYNTPKGPLKWTGTGWVSP